MEINVIEIHYNGINLYTWITKSYLDQKLRIAPNSTFNKEHYPMVF